MSARGAVLCLSLFSDSPFHEAAFERLCGSRLHNVCFPFLNFCLILLMKMRKLKEQLSQRHEVIKYFLWAFSDRLFQIV